MKEFFNRFKDGLVAGLQLIAVSVFAIIATLIVPLLIIFSDGWARDFHNWFSISEEEE